jgi:HEPN domain-containing protein
MKWDEQRDQLLAKAAEDQKAMLVLAADAETSDATVGFHAQQAVEKCLKALLCHLRVNYQKSHDLVVLLDAITDAGQPVPADVDKCKYLEPYAVLFRYDDIPVGEQSPLNRLTVQQEVECVRKWVMQIITGGVQNP